MEKQTQVWIIIGVLIVLILLGLYSFVGITGNVVSDQSGTIKIGFMGPLTGDAASYGESIKRGVDLALKDSGLRNIKIIYEDSKCEPKEAVSAVNKLISVDNVIAIVGEVCSGATLAAAPIAEEKKIVMISASSTSPAITKAGEYIFRTVPSDALQGDFGANLVYNKGYRKLAILYSNEEYGVGFEKVLRESFEKLGGQVVASEKFERGASDVSSQVTKIKESGADAIYIISNSPDSAVAALKKIKEQGINAALIGSEGLKSDDIIKGAGSAAEGLILTSVSSGTSSFRENHKRVYGTEPGPFAAQAYDAFKALSLTLKEGAKTGAAVKNELYDVKFKGASGSIEFDSDGEVSGNYEVYVVRNGKFELVE